MLKENKENLLKFPCRFAIKVMGIKHDELVSGVTSIIAKHSVTFNPGQDIATKLSSKGAYLSITATIDAESQQQLDSIYQELNQHNLVKITL